MARLVLPLVLAAACGGAPKTAARPAAAPRAGLQIKLTTIYVDDQDKALRFADYERIKGKGAEFTMPPTDITFATIAILKDTCGNLVQITQLAR